jgi:hypothetical protein
MLVEQAIFASARHGHAEGYHLVERTPGLTESDARELSHWGPSHDSLVDSGPDAVSCNFFGLESGAYCVSKTVAAGAEYSGRGGAQVQTQCLVVPAAVLARFSNNPFAVLRAAASDDLHTGAANGTQDSAARRAPLRLVGRAAAVDHMLLAQLALAPGPEAMAALVQCELSRRRLVVVCENGERLLAGLISCLPLERRLGISFSTGLKLSPRRPFRISTAPADSPELRRQARALDAEVLLVDQIGQIAVTADSWPGSVEVALRESRFSQLAAEIVRRGTPVSITAASAGYPAQSELAEMPCSTVAADRNSAAAGELAPRRDPPPTASRRFGRSDESHHQMEQSQPSAAGKVFTHPQTQVPGHEDPAALELVEKLDDLVFDAIAGKPGAYDRLAEFWPEVLVRLDPAVLAEAREQYLRHALGVWTRNDRQGNQNAQRSVTALDVLCLLFPGFA